MYKYAGKKNSLIWDGDDSGITERAYPYKCIDCGEQNLYQTTDMLDLRTNPSELVDFLLANRLVSKTDGSYYVKNGIPAYTIECKCVKCGKKHYVLIGFKEAQPQRYNIYKKSIVANQ